MRFVISCFLLFFLSCSLAIGQEQTGTGFEGDGGGAVDPISVECLAPESKLWGQSAQITGSASGGTPGYSYSFVVYCGAWEPPAHGAPTSVNGTANTTHVCHVVGDFTAKCYANDTVPVTASDSDDFPVLAPNKLIPPATATGTATSGATVASISVLVKIPVKRDDELVGDHTEWGWAAEKKAGFDQAGNQLPWGEYTTKDDQVAGLFSLVGNEIQDTKGFTVTDPVVWDNLLDGSDIPGGKFLQQYRVYYPLCDNSEDFVESLIYEVKFKKINDTTVVVEHTVVPGQ